MQLGTNGKPKYEFFLGARNREQKRNISQFAKGIRGKHGVSLGMSLGSENLANSTGKINYFWSDLKGESKGNMLFNLLRSYDPQVHATPRQNPDDLPAAIPVYNQVLERFNDASPKSLAHVQVGGHFAWSVWLRVAKDLERWDSLSRDTQEKVVNAVYAIACIFLEEWFLEEAVRLVPSLAGDALKPYFDLLAESVNTEAIAAAVECAGNGGKFSEDDDTWGVLGHALTDLAGRIASECAPVPTLVEELRDLTSRYEELLARAQTRAEALKVVTDEVRSLIQKLRELAAKEGFDWLPLNDIEDRWAMGLLTAWNDEENSIEAPAAFIRLAEEALPGLEAEYLEHQAALHAQNDRIDEMRRLLLVDKCNRTAIREEIRQGEDRLFHYLEEQDQRQVEFVNQIAPPISLDEGDTLEGCFNQLAAELGNDLVLVEIATFRTRSLQLEERIEAAVSSVVSEPIAVTSAPASIDDLVTVPEVSILAAPQQMARELAATEAAPAEAKDMSAPASVEESVTVPEVAILAAPQQMARELAATEAAPAEAKDILVEALEAATPPLVTVSPPSPVKVEPESLLEPTACGKDERAERLWYFAGEGEPAIAARLADAGPIPRELFEVAALARVVQMPSGAISQEIFSRLSSGHVTERLEALNGLERRVANLVAIAATFRPSVLLSDAQVSALLSTVKVSGNLPHTAQVVEALLKASSTLQSNPMTAEVLRQVISVKTRDIAMEDCRREAANWLATVEDRSRSRYHAAKKTFLVMATPGENGIFQDLLKPVVSNDKRQIASVRKLIALLEDKNRYERKIDEIDRSLSVKRAEKIAYRALDWLHEERLAALFIAQNWLSLMSLEQEQGYIQEVVLQAIRVVQSQRESVINELEQLIASQDEVGKAAVLALNGFNALLEICGGGLPLPPTEPTVSAVLVEPFLRLPGFHILEKGGLDPNADERELLLQGTLEAWSQVWRMKAEEGDYLGASVAAVRLPSEERPVVIETLASMERQDRSRLIHEAKQTEVAVRTLARLRGIPDMNAEALLQEINSEINGLQQESQPERRLDRTRATLRRAQDAVADAERKVAQNLREGVEELVNEGRAPRVLELVQKNILARNFVVAEEYMDLARNAGDSALEYIAMEQEDVFGKFYPEITSTLTKVVGDSTTDDIAQTIANGADLPPLSFKELEPDRRQNAKELWVNWRRLKVVRAGKPEVANIVAEVARGLGLGSSPVGVLQSGSRQDRVVVHVTTDLLADRHRCPVHQYGSSAKGLYRVIVSHHRLTAPELVRLAAEDANSSVPPIIFHVGAMSDRTRRELGAECRTKKITLVVIDDVLMLYLCSRPGDRLPVMFACTLPFSGIDPFVTVANQPIPPEMFFGRETEIQSIVSPQGSCLVYGGRQLGKTALLREVERQFHAPSRGRYACHDEIKVNSPSEVWNRLRLSLERAGIDLGKFDRFDPERPEQVQNLVSAIERWLKEHPTARILALLDEADNFLSRDSVDNYPHTQQIKLLIANTQGRFKAVFAGLHNVLRMSTRSNHPLAHLGTPIQVGPFLQGIEIAQAYHLIRDPLRALGYRFSGIEQVTQILGQTNYYPSLIQLYCQQLLHALATRPRERGGYVEIDSRIIDSAYQIRKLPDLIKEKLDITLRLDERYAVIAQALAFEIVSGGITLKEGLDIYALRTLVNEYWPDGFASTSSQAFAALLDELDTLGILTRVTDVRDHYTFRNANALMLMGSEKAILTDLESQRELVTEIDPSLVHAPISSANRTLRSPFNHSQERQIKDAIREVLLVCGTELSPLDRIQDGLRVIFEEKVLRASGKNTKLDSTELTRKLKEAVSLWKKGGSGVILVPADAGWRPSWLESTREWLHREASTIDIRVVFVANAVSMKAAISTVQERKIPVVTLDAWNENFVYAWLQDIGIVLNPLVKRELYRITGGWGGLLADFVGKAPSLTQVQAQLADMADIPPEERPLWQKRLGVVEGGGLELAVPFLEALGAGVTAEELREFINEDPTPWVVWARYMGFVVAEIEGEGWQLNPLVAEVFRTEPTALAAT